MKGARILLVDDDAALLEALPQALALRLDKVQIDTADAAPLALQRIRETDYDAIVSDVKMPGMDGLALLAEIREIRPTTPTLLITGHGEHDLAVQALRGGAYDFVQKPIDRDYFVASLTRAIEMRQLDREVEAQRLALERHARVLEHVGDGVFLVDREGVIQLWNPGAAAATGLAPEAVLGRRAEEALPGWSDVAERIPVAVAPGSSEGGARTVPLEAGGQELWISISGVEFADGTVYAFRNLTEERVLEELKGDFIATVSHELRTPLAAIYGSAQTLRQRSAELGDESKRRLLAVIAEESERLTRIVSQILLASRLDADRMPLAHEQIDVLRLIRDVIETMRVSFEREVEIELVAPDSLPLISGDPEKLRQVLLNLIENAVKYSPQHRRVVVTAEEQEGRLRLAVGDEGLGIPLREQGRIFAKFYRVDPNLTRGVGGTGLGLYICRELVRRMRGRIWLSSEEGVGSTFYIDFPLAAASSSSTGERVKQSA